MDKDLLARNLRALRTARGWSQTQTADRAGVAQTVLSRLERGAGIQPSIGVMERLASTFGVTIERLTSEAAAVSVGFSAPTPAEGPRTNHIAENIVALRDARGWSQAQTAQAAGITQTAVSRLERGVSVNHRAELAECVAKAFGVTVDRLVHEDLTAAAGRIADVQSSEPSTTPDAPAVRLVATTPVRPSALESAVFAAVTSRSLPLEVLDASRAVALRVAADLPDGTCAEDAAGAIVEAVQRLRGDGKHPDAVAVLAVIAFGPRAVTLHHAVRRLAAGRRLLGHQLARDAGMLDEATLAQKAAEFHDAPPSPVPLDCAVRTLLSVIGPSLEFDEVVVATGASLDAATESLERLARKP